MSAYPYLQDEHTPVSSESEATPCVVQGELPKDLAGTFARNSPNPRFEPLGRYHWFDGDGMVHAISVQDGKATYRAKWIRTEGLRLEEEAGQALFTGILEKPRPGAPGPLKDTANTDLVWHDGKLLALWWLSGTPMGLSLPNLDTLGPQRFGGGLPRGMAAHAKVDAASGELMFFEFSLFKPPFYRYGVVSKSGELVSCEAIDVAGPRIPHDIAITPRFTVLLDLPLGWDVAALAAGKRRIGFDKAAPARIGIIPRHGKGAEVRWFQIEPCYAYHTVNAYEEGPNVCLIGCAIDDPIPQKREESGNTTMLDNIALVPILRKWTMNLETGAVKQETLDDTPSEFPRTNEALQGQKIRFSYHGRLARRPSMMFDAVLKYDFVKGTHETIDVPAGWYAGEPSFAPRVNAKDEDDGYIVTAITNASDSEFWVVDAKTHQTAARVRLPRKIPIGFHSTWVPGARETT